MQLPSTAARLLPARMRPTVPPWQLAAVLAASLISAYVLVRTGDWRITFGLFAAAGLVMLGLVRPAAFLVLFLMVRPLLDGLSEEKGGPVASVFGLLAIGVVGAMVLTAAPTRSPAASTPFGAVLALSALACIPALLHYGDQIGYKPMAELGRLVAMLAVYILAANLFTSPRRLQGVFAVVGLSAAVPAIMGVNELLGGGPKTDDLDIQRISGPFSGPNPFGLYLAVAALVLIALPRRALPVWLRLPTLGLVLVALTGTYSRAGWALFVIGFVLLGWRERRVLVACGAVAVTGLVFLVPSVHDRVLPPPKSPTASGIVTPESYSFRLKNWDRLLEKWAESPLLGYGLATVPYANPYLAGRSPATARGYEAHNSVVKLLVEGGVVLLATYVALVVAILRSLRRVAGRAWSGRAFARITLILWTGVLVIGIGTDDPLAATAMMYALFAMTGAVEGAFVLATARPIATNGALVTAV